jgi:putative membrane protein
MRHFLLRWAVLTLAFALTDAILTGMKVTGGFFALVGVAAIFGIVNAVLGTILRILTLPITILTLGLFALLVNAALLAITAGISSNLTINGFWTAVFAALIITIVSAILNRVVIGKRG